MDGQKNKPTILPLSLDGRGIKGEGEQQDNPTQCHSEQSEESKISAPHFPPPVILDCTRHSRVGGKPQGGRVTRVNKSNQQSHYPYSSIPINVNSPRCGYCLKASMTGEGWCCLVVCPPFTSGLRIKSAMTAVVASSYSAWRVSSPADSASRPE